MRVLVPPRPAAEDTVGADQRDAGDHGGFERESAEVFRFEIVHVGLAAGAGEDLDFGNGGAEPVGDARGLLHLLGKFCLHDYDSGYTTKPRGNLLPALVASQQPHQLADLLPDICLEPNVIAQFLPQMLPEPLRGLLQPVPDLFSTHSQPVRQRLLARRSSCEAG